LTPLVKNFVADSFLLIIFESGHRFESRRIFGNEGTLDQKLSHLGKLIFPGKSLDISGDLLWREMGKRILDPEQLSDIGLLI